MSESSFENIAEQHVEKYVKVSETYKDQARNMHFLGMKVIEEGQDVAKKLLLAYNGLSSKHAKLCLATERFIAIAEALLAQMESHPEMESEQWLKDREELKADILFAKEQIAQVKGGQVT